MAALTRLCQREDQRRKFRSTSRKTASSASAASVSRLSRRCLRTRAEYRLSCFSVTPIPPLSYGRFGKAFFRNFTVFDAKQPDVWYNIVSPCFLSGALPCWQEENHAQSRRSSACAAPFQGAHQKPNFVLSVAATTIRLSFVLAFVRRPCASGRGGRHRQRRLSIPRRRSISPRWMLRIKLPFIYDSQNLITDYKGTEDRIMVSIDEIPEMLQNAFIAVEDARFYEHNGVDVKRIVGALVANFPAAPRRGSTITQQLIKQTVLSSEQSTSANCREAYLAMELETRYTKADSGKLSEHHLPRRQLLRRARGGLRLFRQVARSAPPCANVRCSPG